MQSELHTTTFLVICYHYRCQQTDGVGRPKSCHTLAWCTFEPSRVHRFDSIVLKSQLLSNFLINPNSVTLTVTCSD